MGGKSGSGGTVEKYCVEIVGWGMCQVFVKQSEGANRKTIRVFGDNRVLLHPSYVTYEDDKFYYVNDVKISKPSGM